MIVQIIWHFPSSSPCSASNEAANWAENSTRHVDLFQYFLHLHWLLREGRYKAQSPNYVGKGETSLLGVRDFTLQSVKGTFTPKLSCHNRYNSCFDNGVND